MATNKNFQYFTTPKTYSYEGSLFFSLILFSLQVQAQNPRARDTGIPFEGTPGSYSTIINAMVAAETMEGINSNKAYALPQKKVMELLRKYGRVK